MFVAYALLIALFGVICFACGMTVGLSIIRVFDQEDEDGESKKEENQVQ